MRTRTISRTLSISLAPVALLLGCATHYTWQASVPIPGPVGGACLMAALDAEDDVFDLVSTGEDRVAFLLSLPDRKRKDWPGFSLHATDVLRGEPRLTLSTRYAEGMFEPDPNAQITRAGALIAKVTEQCTGRRPTLSPPEPCGAGEYHDLCVQGSL